MESFNKNNSDETLNVDIIDNQDSIEIQEDVQENLVVNEIEEGITVYDIVYDVNDILAAVA